MYSIVIIVIIVIVIIIIMCDSEPFAFITSSGSNRLYDDYQQLTSAKIPDLDLQLVDSLRTKFPEMIVTAIPTFNVDLLEFAAAGFAQAELDTKTDSKLSWRGYIPPEERGGLGDVADAVFFAKYHYRWGHEDFIVYFVAMGMLSMQYVLKEPASGETKLSHSSKTDALIAAIGASTQNAEDFIYVYDGYWTGSTKLWKEVQKASWDDVILSSAMKKELTEVSEKFFDSKSICCCVTMAFG